MACNEIIRTSVGADLSCPSPIYRPSPRQRFLPLDLPDLPDPLSRLDSNFSNTLNTLDIVDLPDLPDLLSRLDSNFSYDPGRLCSFQC
jgi:hypothetical protein